ncbi:3-dehydro-L-gulonate 2-dehydrogenase [Anaerococcus sp. AGMB00486]|uniref:3-dehydro-L-gulonate 2-dehydrogenase n=2 Tax=Anaerococcus TaxID=165779 RepID=A0ABX2N6V3_9FIRM|nr:MULTISPECIES: 3-dehydro-L-gulonate 2-dehydrogenase [Anaerococcus]MDY3005971.1 3-dehydro-L-gulonate 2-dehydrogenase [Anaerococcus porci]MSS77089.1 3-dehydro-L-gulonate 2-dehydrogenase [Anaerococcus porci]NVF10419.1 3-dehydro-L-gulonate 2-dehydrogenase [Anaerococcus faecalis]
MKVKYDILKNTIKLALLKNCVSEEDAEIMAKVHADSTLIGVNSHGLNRIPRLINFINDGLININGKLKLIKKFGAIENYDANLGFGVINSIKASKRAAELAIENGIGMVSVKNSTHWMRAGTYGELIAERGMIALCFTNTESLMPLWGSDEKSIGNNPMCIAIPSKSGNIILDMAISQYSYGKLDSSKIKNEYLPYPGGFDSEGNLTNDPNKIIESQRLLPIGYWKGSGLSLCLDAMASLLSTGKSTYDMDEDKAFNCTGCSQIFIAMNPEVFSTEQENEKVIEKIKQKVHSVRTLEENSSVRFPGEGSIKRKDKNLKEGIEVDDFYYEKVKSFINV